MAPKVWGRAALSGFLLTLAFPRWQLWFLAWIALVPLFYSLDDAKDRKEAFFLAFTAGFVFYLLSISWLRHVTVFGLFFVVTMLSVYWGIFGVLCYHVGAGPRVRPELGQPQGVAPTFLLSAIWVALEWLRSEAPVWGFGWNLLGNSQAPNLWIAQLASVGGVYSISFLVFLGNFVVYRIFRRGVKQNFQTALLFFSLIGAVAVFGWSRIESFNPTSFLRVSVIQGNIPQLLKWEETYKREILRVYLNLTELASYDKPQLIVWPEAAYPGFFNQDYLARRVLEKARKIKIPLVVGSPHAGEAGTYYNSAYLVTPSPFPLPPVGGEGFGEGGISVLPRYDKIRLVPFGEYVPWKPVFGFLERFAYSLGVSDFSPGKDFTVFPLAGSSAKFSTLVCFEDTFPDLAREFVKRGADFLVVITNDAWFGHSSAAYQHAQASQLRAIENGVSVVRAANTGISGFITPLGRLEERVKNQEGKDTFIIGGMTYPVILDKQETLFRKGGWIFPYLCLLVFVATLFSKPRFFKLGLLAILLTGCVRLQGGAFFAKKINPDEPPQVKEVYVDSDKLLGRESKTPGRIEV